MASTTATTTAVVAKMVVRRSQPLTVLLLLVLALAHGFKVPPTPVANYMVKELSNDNFDMNVAHGVWVVKFTVPWCRHCKDLVKEFESAAYIAEAAAKSAKPQVSQPYESEVEPEEDRRIVFGSVDVSQQRVLRSRFGVYQFPTIKLFRDGKWVRDYNALPRTANGIIDFVHAALKASELQSVPWSAESLRNFAETRISPSFDKPTGIPFTTGRHTETDYREKLAVSCFVLNCGAVEASSVTASTMQQDSILASQKARCFQAVAVFTALAVQYFEHHCFAFAAAHDVDEDNNTRTPSVVAIHRNGPFPEDRALIAPPELLWPFDSAALLQFFHASRWPLVVGLDLNRFRSFRESAKQLKSLTGLVVAGLNPTRSSEWRGAIEKLEAIATKKFWRNKFLFGWIDAQNEFRKGLVDLGALRLPHVVVFSANNSRTIWTDPARLALAHLEYGLAGILEGKLPPVGQGGLRRQLLDSSRRTLAHAWDFATSSATNATLVVLLAILSSTVIGTVSYWRQKGKNNELLATVAAQTHIRGDQIQSRRNTTTIIPYERSGGVPYEAVARHDEEAASHPDSTNVGSRASSTDNGALDEDSTGGIGDSTIIGDEPEQFGTSTHVAVMGHRDRLSPKIGIEDVTRAHEEKKRR